MLSRTYFLKNNIFLWFPMITEWFIKNQIRINQM